MKGWNVAGFCHGNPETRSEGQIFIGQVPQKAQAKKAKPSSEREKAERGWEQAGAICAPNPPQVAQVARVAQVGELFHPHRG